MPLAPKVHMRDTKIGKAKVGREFDRSGNYFDSVATVAELTQATFDEYLKQRDAVLVLFYDIFAPDAIYAKKHIIKASEITKRTNSGYAGVNCANGPDLCQREGIEDVNLPSFKLYSRGNEVSKIMEYSGLTADVMTQYVEMCPILVQPFPKRILVNRFEATLNKTKRWTLGCQLSPDGRSLSYQGISLSSPGKSLPRQQSHSFNLAMPLAPKVHLRDTKISQQKDNIESDQHGSFFTLCGTVAELNRHYFDEYLTEKDALLVLFYDRFNPDDHYAKRHMIKASKMNKRPNAGYAGVNCQQEPEICRREGVVEYPFFKLYSRGHPVSTIREYSGFTADVMNSYVKKCPVLEEPLPAVRLCERSEINPQPQKATAESLGSKPVWPAEKKKRSLLSLKSKK